MKATLAAILAGALVVVLSITFRPLDAQNGGEREIRSVRDFDSIVVGGSIDLTIRQSDEFLVEVLASDGDLEDVITDVDGSTLAIRSRPGAGNFFGLFPTGAEVAVSLPVLSSVRASGGSDVTGLGVITGEALRISTSGGSDLDLAVDLQSLEVSTSGGSDVYLSGTVASAQFSASGGSDLDARSLEANEVQISSSGGSDAFVRVSDRLTGRASGGSDVIYSGEPSVVNVNVSGGADLVRR